MLAGASLFIAMPLAAIYATGTLAGTDMARDSTRWRGCMAASTSWGSRCRRWSPGPSTGDWLPHPRPVARAVDPRQALVLGFVIGAIFGFGVLVGGTLVGALGIIALALLALNAAG